MSQQTELLSISETKVTLPKVSIVAPCRNEAAYIEKTIMSILQSDYPSDIMELLVVDGMSTDGTREIVEAMAQKDNRIKIIDNPDKIVPSAMNIGIRRARGNYIIRIDCHSTFAPDYISKCIEISQRTGAENVGGYIETLPGADTAIARAIAQATSSRFGVGNSAFRLSGPEQQVDTVPFGTFRKELFKKTGLYDERLARNQDIELNSRIRKAGGRIIISPEIKLCYYNRATYLQLWRQSFNNGLWNPYTLWLAGGGLSIRHFVPMFFVLGLITLVASTIFFEVTKWVLLGYISIYLSAAFCFAVRSAEKMNISVLLILWSFITLHTAYGLGSLWSIVTIPYFAGREIKCEKHNTIHV
jgi:glycosyltransferase involved in cell wall biosynthesis